MPEKDIFLRHIEKPMADFSMFSDYSPFFAHPDFQNYLASLKSPSDFIADLAPSLLRIDSFYASCLSLMAGAMIERGGDHKPIIQSVLTLLERQLRNLELYQSLRRRANDEELFHTRPEAVRAHHGISLTGFAAMTMLSRDVSARIAWRQTPILKFLEAFAEDYTPLDYLLLVYQLTDNQELLILDPANQRGYLFQVVAIQNLYHCYCILQHRLLEIAGPNYLSNQEPTNIDVVQYAQNRGSAAEMAEDQPERLASDHQRFSFMSYQALSKDGVLDTANISFGCYGSQHFQEIPLFEGRATLLIGPKTSLFQWEPRNMHPILHEDLHADVTLIRELSASEVQGYLQRIRQSSSTTKE